VAYSIIVNTTVEDSEKLLHFVRQFLYSEEPIRVAMIEDIM
jgi:hypothetical protein